MGACESDKFMKHLPFLEEEISPVDKKVPKITLNAYTETGREGSTIPVLKQRSYTGIKVIPSALANTPCTTLGIVGILDEFNATLGKSYRLDSHPTLHSFLNSCIERNYDFGTAYAHFRYNSSWVRTSTNLHKGEVKDGEMRRDAVIHDGRIIRRKSVPPRRIWDLCANRVVPYWVASRGSPMSVRVEGISHAWMDANDRRDVWTPINGCEWPVPLPNDADLDLIRIELLNLLGVLGVEYVWLDVLCLRQKYDFREDYREEDLRGEALRIDEWKLDVPTIGYVYESSVQMVCYLCGLGQPLSWAPAYLVGERSWFNRAWTLQETRDRYQHQAIIAGETSDDNTRTMFRNKLESLRDVFSAKDIILQMRTRVSTNPIDRVAGLVYRLRLRYITIYDANQSEESAWEQLVNAMMYSFRADLFFCYPEPGDGRKYWRPSCTQVMDTTFPTDPSIWSSITGFLQNNENRSNFFSAAQYSNSPSWIPPNA
ncbi:uncharacterized protein EV420DRAFT_1202271 [Desarmillaria tabescens]|uniref:Heterokaryon incompatibility domain-containing protein n=1 Tax=Armillaria tabescens TaxID=1929756 RepID=A0AA39MM76_ARMTA|nr:uncharacterized protein EV420DRAFT_1202271 [Desarmillaria tabescens]KAK0439068.1 hypothetical protein EV420DRAFT_1202271 [Desarmillaria tabescens]